MSESKKIAIVTGSNRGIGKEVVRQLSQFEDTHVILTSRNETEGQAAIQEIGGPSESISYHQLEIGRAHV